MKKLLSVLMLFICLISGCSCNKEEVTQSYIVSIPVPAFINKDDGYYNRTSPFGTYIRVVGYDKDELYDLEDEFNGLVTKYHSLLDRHYYYRETDGTIINNIRVINESYGSGEAIEVNDIIIEVLKYGIEYTKLSEGKFNILAGSIVSLWDIRFNWLIGDYYKVDPTQEQVDVALACVPAVSEIDNVLVIDEENKTVTFNKFDGCESGASITLGALAKSYFIDELNEQKNIKALKQYILDAGKSSIILRGDNPTRKGGIYNIGVANSYTSTKDDFAVQLQLASDCAVSTSSGDEKGYIKEDGTRRHHIIDATSGYPNTYLLAATVITDSAMIADIMTTTLMTMESMEEIQDYLSLLKNNGIDAKVLLQIEENEALSVYVNDSMKRVIGEVFDGVTVKEFSYGTQA